jgi:predicted RNA-binding Zn ribbon-like protein
MDSNLNSPYFDFIGGALCLDFANTADWHASPQPRERLKHIADLLIWGRMAGLLAEAEVQAMLQSSEYQLQKAHIALKRAIELREAIYHIFVRHIRGENPSQAEIKSFNAMLQRALCHLHLLPEGAGFVRCWEIGGEELERVLWPVAWSAAELLTSDLLGRVGQCADDRGCGYLFLDTSRNRTRRWCSMEGCGNRAKALRHYARKS